jgi:phosphatidylglycerophosphatase A
MLDDLLAGVYGAACLVMLRNGFGI